MTRRWARRTARRKLKQHDTWKQRDDPYGRTARGFKRQLSRLEIEDIRKKRNKDKA